MDEAGIHPERIRLLNGRPEAKGQYVLYWMQQSQRPEWNQALSFAIAQANRLQQPLVVAFGLTADYPEANLRHYAFMLDGFSETQSTLAEMGIRMAVQTGDPADVALKVGKKASLIVCDRGYLRHQKAWRKKVAEMARCKVVQVESDVVVPVDAVSDKAEYAARTIRPKIQRLLPGYLVGLDETMPKVPSLYVDIESLDLSAPDLVLDSLPVSREVGASPFFKGGTSEAKRRFLKFLETSLESYDRNSNQPQTEDISHTSPYLHFGQISPLWLALQVQNFDGAPDIAKDAFLEQLIVRRELAMNFVNFTPAYDSVECLSEWAV
ncbi:MAG: deoxyribodipyrimidine photo-lyase, partial [Candidatus Coatesbacteria bacterium]|nr:deoxyribodipyrimidine photo-lyase [Candidatus Coatesbacteria bacterium]